MEIKNNKPNNLNIPLDILNKYKDDRRDWELLCFAICIKMYSESSRIPNDVVTVRRLLNCGHYKAQRMLANAKKCPDLFFVYENEKFIVARSFTFHGKLQRKEVMCNKKQYTAYQTKCIRYGYKKGEQIKHDFIQRDLRDRLIKNAIIARGGRVCSTTIKVNKTTKQNTPQPIGQDQLREASGYGCVVTVQNHLKKMVKTGEVVVEAAKATPIQDLRTGEVLTDDKSLLERNTFEWKGKKYACVPNKYAVVNPQKEDYACNIIFNHKQRRQKHHASLVNIRRKNESRADFYNRTVLAMILR